MALKKYPVQLIGLDRIAVDHDELQSREKTDINIVHDFSELMREDTIFPPVVVFWDGKTYWLADGFHRYEAARHAELGQIRCEVRDGGRRDAIIYSAGANKAFSIVRTWADKRKSCFMLFDFPDWRVKPVPEIAAHVGVKSTKVHEYRLEYCKKNGHPVKAEDELRAKRVDHAAGLTQAQVIDREERAWEMSRKGKTHGEIADKLGMTRQGVSSMIARLKARHIEKLDEEVQKVLYPAEVVAAAESPDDGPVWDPPRPSDPKDELDEYDESRPITSALRIMVRGSRIDRLCRAIGCDQRTLERFAMGQYNLSLEIADRLAVYYRMKMVKGTQ